MGAPSSYESQRRDDTTGYQNGIPQQYGRRATCPIAHGLRRGNMTRRKLETVATLDVDFVVHLSFFIILLGVYSDVFYVVLMYVNGINCCSDV